jgi:hypothetical protein
MKYLEFKLQIGTIIKQKLNYKGQDKEKVKLIRCKWQM